jgi:flagellar P-ring protein precursor FlgI
MKKLFLLLLIAANLYPQRIKDISYFSTNDSKQIIGYGLIVGLAGTGDSYRSTFTVQSITSMLKRFGITVPQNETKVKNVAAVIVTATLNSDLKPGAKFDVNVSSLGDASSLLGGTLLMTPLSGIDGNVYAMSQGSISIGGFDFNTSTGSRTSKNHALTGRVPNGGILEQLLKPEITASLDLVLYLKNPDATTSINVTNAINNKFGNKTAFSVDAAEIKIKVPANKADNQVGFISELEGLKVEIDYLAKVVLNERTGTVVAGSNVTIKPVVISHGGLNLTVRSNPFISQPGPFSGGQTAVVQNLVPSVVQDSTNAVVINGASTVQEVASALNSLKVSPKDIIEIFQALKESGALIAELVIL